MRAGYQNFYGIPSRFICQVQSDTKHVIFVTAVNSFTQHGGLGGLEPRPTHPRSRYCGVVVSSQQRDESSRRPTMDPGHHDEEGQEQRPPLPLNAIIDFGAAAHQGDLQRMRSMIEEQRCDINGVPPAWKSIYQPTPLAYAVWGNQPEAVKLLLEAGADPDHVDGVRRNPSFPRPLSVSARSPSLSPLIAGQQLPSFALGIVQE